MSDKTATIPRTVWTLWYQGLAAAPLVVRRCIDSWIEQNPTWNVVVLDSDNLTDYVQLDLPPAKLATLPLTKQSNLVRLQLLSENGGVWADATTICMRPLDTWIDGYTRSGFFAFEWPGRDRLISNWFMVSERHGPIVARLQKRYVSFFMENDFELNMDGRLQHAAVTRFERLLNRSTRTTRFWFLPIFTKLLRIYPYFIFHYMFARLVATDPVCRRVWCDTKRISADIPHRLQVGMGLLGPLTPELKEEIDERQAPLYKLTWKYNPDDCQSSSVLHYLLEGS